MREKSWVAGKGVEDGEEQMKCCGCSGEARDQASHSFTSTHCTYVTWQYILHRTTLIEQGKTSHDSQRFHVKESDEDNSHITGSSSLVKITGRKEVYGHYLFPAIKHSIVHSAAPNLQATRHPPRKLDSPRFDKAIAQSAAL